MAGTLVISTLSDGTNSTSSTNCIRGSAKAWLYCNASTVLSSYNISSFTFSGGNYSINFTNAMSDANYCVVALNDSGNTYLNSNDPAQRLAGSFRLNTNSTVGINCAVFR